MLYLVTGHVGGGKTYACVEWAIEAMREGATVHHSRCGIYNDKLAEFGTPEQVVELPEDPAEWDAHLVYGKEGQENVLIVDEAAILFGCEDSQKQAKTHAELFRVMALHRKLGLECYYITQDPDNIHAKLRRIASREVRCVSVRRILLIGYWWAKLRGDFMRITYTGKDKKRVAMKTEYARFNSEIGACYDTEDTAGNTMRGRRNVTRVQRDQGSESGKYLVPVILLIMFAAGWYVVAQMSQRLRSAKATLAAAKGSTSAPSVPGLPVASASVPLPATSSPSPAFDAAVTGYLHAIKSELGALTLYTGAGNAKPGLPYLGSQVLELSMQPGQWTIVLQDGRVLPVRAMTPLERRAEYAKVTPSWTSQTSPSFALAGSAAGQQDSPPGPLSQISSTLFKRASE